MGRPLMKDEEYTMPSNLRRLFTVKELKADVESELMLKKGRTRRVNVTATFLDGHTENVTDSVHIDVPDFMTVNGNLLKSVDEGYGEVTISYTDFARTTSQLKITVATSTEVGIVTPQASGSQLPTQNIFNANIGNRIYMSMYPST